MNDQKELWERLAKENSKYYINSDYGKGITEEEFWQSGENDYFRFIQSDTLIFVERYTPNMTLLEVGCGTGRMTRFMTRDFKEVIGVDVSGEMIKQAKENLKYQNVKLLETDGYTFPLKDNSVDFVFSYIVFQHFKTMEMIESNFKESFRVLKPGGMMKVRVRTDNVEDKMNRWWSGVHCDESYPVSIGFKLIKKEPVEHYGLWLWLKKP